MVACQNCGKLNAFESHFCRFCGTKMTAQQPVVQDPHPYGHGAPRPYAWKTDEFETSRPQRGTDQINSGHLPDNTSPIYQPAPLAPQSYHPAAWSAMPLDANYRCPRCGTPYHPVMDRRVSTAGWIVFSVLLVTTVIFFWVGLLMKEDVAVCPMCRSKLS